MNSEIIIYQTADGQTAVDTRLEQDTVWLTQKQMVELFQTTKQNISLHIKNCFAEGELSPDSTVKEYLTVQQEGTRRIERLVEYYRASCKSRRGRVVASQKRSENRSLLVVNEDLREFLARPEPAAVLLQEALQSGYYYFGRISGKITARHPVPHLG